MPLIPADKGGHGLHDATTDPTIIRRWWEAKPDANIGLRTGVAFDVVDLDSEQAVDALEAARDGRERISGPVVATAKGFHYFVQPTGLGNRAGVLPGIDFRGQGGYVVAPPSVHPSGAQYRLIVRDRIGPAPSWLVNLIQPPERSAVNNCKELTVGSAYGRAAMRRELGRAGDGPGGHPQRPAQPFGFRSWTARQLRRTRRRRDQGRADVRCRALGSAPESASARLQVGSGRGWSSRERSQSARSQKIVVAGDPGPGLTGEVATRPLLHMDTTALIALIAALGSLLATLAKIIWDALEKRRERKSAERAELRRYRSILLRATDELGSRIGNIRFGYFFDLYLAKGDDREGEDDREEDDRRPIALRSTLFRFGQYFTWAEIYREYMRLNPNKVSHKTNPEKISKTLGLITSAFASDETDVDGDISRLMLWREEQSAIADSMRKRGPTPECIGFSAFANDYKDRYAKWFQRFERDLESIFSPPPEEEAADSERPVEGADSERLAEVTALLVELIVLLDVEKAVLEYENGQHIPPRWSRPDEPQEVLPEEAADNRGQSDIGQ